MSSTENYFISPIVIRVNASTIKSFQTSLWVHCSPKFHWNVADFPGDWKKHAQDCFLPIFFANQLKLAERCCSRILWHFQDSSWVSYLCSSWWVGGSPNLPLPPKKVAPVQKLRARAKSQGFPLFAQLRNYPRRQASAVFLFFSQQMSKDDLNRSTEKLKPHWSTQSIIVSCTSYIRKFLSLDALASLELGPVSIT